MHGMIRHRGIFSHGRKSIIIIDVSDFRSIVSASIWLVFQTNPTAADHISHFLDFKGLSHVRIDQLTLNKLVIISIIIFTFVLFLHSNSFDAILARVEWPINRVMNGSPAKYSISDFAVPDWSTRISSARGNGFGSADSISISVGTVQISTMNDTKGNWTDRFGRRKVYIGDEKDLKSRPSRPNWTSLWLHPQHHSEGRFIIFNKWMRWNPGAKRNEFGQKSFSILTFQ
jgi:hypothetical protein